MVAEVIALFRSSGMPLFYDRPDLLNVKATEAEFDEYFILFEEVTTGGHKLTAADLRDRLTMAFAVVYRTELSTDAEEHVERLDECRRRTRTLLEQLRNLDAVEVLEGTTSRKVEEHEFDDNVIGWRVTANLVIIEGC